MTYSLDLRNRVVACIKGGKTHKETAKIFSIHPKTIAAWLRRPDLRPTVVKTRKRIIDRDALYKNVAENSSLTLKERAKKFGVSINTIHYHLKRMRIVKKKSPGTKSDVICQGPYSSGTSGALQESMVLIILFILTNLLSLQPATGVTAGPPKAKRYSRKSRASAQKRRP